MTPVTPRPARWWWWWWWCLSKALKERRENTPKFLWVKKTRPRNFSKKQKNEDVRPKIWNIHPIQGFNSYWKNKLITPLMTESLFLGTTYVKPYYFGYDGYPGIRERNPWVDRLKTWLTWALSACQAALVLLTLTLPFLQVPGLRGWVCRGCRGWRKF